MMLKSTLFSIPNCVNGIIKTNTKNKDKTLINLFKFLMFIINQHSYITDQICFFAINHIKHTNEIVRNICY